MIAEQKWSIVGSKVIWPSCIMKSKADAKLSETKYDIRLKKTVRQVYEQYLYHYEKTVSLRSKF